MAAAFWISTAAAIAGAALVVFLAPARWRGRAILGWLVLPAVLYFGVVLYEAATRPPQEKLVENALLGFSLISALFIVPWLGVCGLGFGLGYLLRRRLRGPDPPPASRPAPAPVDRTPPQPPSLEHDGWRSVHVGFANDGVTIGGYDVWATPWRDVGAGPLALPHPAHPAQRHSFTIYEFGEGERFAVGELSNGVWGFYVPTGAGTVLPAARPPAGDVETRDSPFGDLRVELQAREWSNTHWVFAPRVVETAGDRVLLDLHDTDWDATVTFPAPGQVTLALRRYRGGAAAEATLDLPAARYELVSAGARTTAPLPELRGALMRL